MRTSHSFRSSYRMAKWVSLSILGLLLIGFVTGGISAEGKEAKFEKTPEAVKTVPEAMPTSADGDVQESTDPRKEEFAQLDQIVQAARETGGEADRATLTRWRELLYQLQGVVDADPDAVTSTPAVTAAEFETPAVNDYAADIEYANAKDHYYLLTDRVNEGAASTGEVAAVQSLCQTYGWELPLALQPWPEADNDGQERGDPLDQGSSDTLTAVIIPSCPYSDTGNYDGTDQCVGTPYNDVFYKFTPTVTGRYHFRARNTTGASGQNASIRIRATTACNGSGGTNVVTSSSAVAADCNETVNQVTYTRAQLTSGTTYYIHVGTVGSTYITTGAYEFSMLCVPCPNWEIDGWGSHATCATAQSITLGDSLLGDSAYSNQNRYDWYTFTKTGYDTVRIYVGAREWGHCLSGGYPSGSTMVDGRYTIYKYNGTCPGDSIIKIDDEGCSVDADAKLCLGPGTYYVKIWNFNNDSSYVFLTSVIATCPAPPANDLCANAIGVGVPSSTAGTTAGATVDAVPTCGTAGTPSAGGVWYAVTGSDHFLTASVCDPGTNFDTKLSVYSGICGSLVCAGGNNDDATCTPTTRSTVTWCSSLGTTYYILVHGGTSSSVGNFTLNVTEGGLCACPAIIACNTPTETENNNTCQTFDAKQLACNDSVFATHCAEADTDFFKITVPAGNSMTVTVYDGAACSTTPPTTVTTRLYSSACAAQGSNSTAARVISRCGLATDTTVYLAVLDITNPGTNRSKYKILTRCIGVPANDNCANAIPLSIPSSVQGSTTCATVESPPPPVCSTTGYTAPGVWYTVVGNGDQLTATLCNAYTNYDTKLFVYSGTSCATLAPVACNDDASPTCSFGSLKSTVSWCSSIGETYYVLVSGYTTNTGLYQLDILDGPVCVVPANDLCANAQTLTVNDPNPVCGNTLGSGNDCSLYNDVWYTFTTTACTDVTILWCGTAATGNQSISLYGTGCCTGGIAYTTTDYTTCGDAKLAVHYNNLAAGTYWVPASFLTPGAFCVRVTGTACPPPFPCLCQTEPNSACNTVGGPIPDVSTSNFVINVNQAYHITDVDVCLDLNHTWDADLDIYLISPSGTMIELSTDNGGGSDNYVCTVFDDEASISIISGAAPFTGSFIPEALLSGFDGQNAYGNWTLRIVDDLGGDVGNVDGVCLLFDYDYIIVPTTAWVNDDWSSNVNGDVVDGHLYGFDAFSDILSGIDAVGGSTVYVYPGTYPTGLVHVTGPVNVVAYDMNAPRPLITATADGAAWFDIDPGIPASFNYLAFDGIGHTITTCIQHQGTGSITSCTFAHIADSPSSYQGYAIDAYGGPLTVENCQFSDIYRVGVYFNDGMTGTIRGNTYTGKGTGDWLDYAFVIGGGSMALVENNIVSGCLGVAGVWTSAGIYCWSDPGVTTMILHGNIVYGNSLGVAVDDAWSFTMWSNATVTNNNLANNVDQALWSVSHNLTEATANWWGDVYGPDQTVLAGGSHHPQRRGEMREQNRRALDDQDDVIGLLHYSPWVATDGSDYDVPAPGWQPNLHTVGVSTNGTIQEGVDMVAGSTVLIAAGIYTGSTVITGSYPSGLFLLGPNAGIDACTGTRVAEAELTSADPNGALQIQTSNVTVSGLKFSNNVKAIHVNGPITGADSVVVLDNIIQNASADGINLWRANTARVQGNSLSAIALSGITAGDDNGTPLFTDDIVTSARIESNCLDDVRFGITGYHDGSIIRFNTIANYASNPVSAGISGQQSGSSIFGNTISGYSISAGISLTPFLNRPNSSNVTIDSNLLTGNAAGVYMADPVSGLVVVGNQFANALYNGYDVNTSYYDHNCWADFTSNGGYPTQYNVPGAGGNVDLNPNVGCGGIGFSVSSYYVGCETACVGDTLYVTFDGTGFLAGQLFIQLAAELDANWAAGNQQQLVMPSSNAATNLVFSAARRSAGNQIELNVQWGPPYSTGNGTQYIATIPIKNATGTHCQTLGVAGSSSTFYDLSGPHIDEFLLGSTNVHVDCEDPAASLSYTSPLTCNAFATAAQFEGLMTASVLRGGVPCNSQLESAYVEVNGIVTQRIWLFNGLLAGDYTNTAFPSSADAATIYDWLNEGCNDLVLHAFDAECNEGRDTLVLIKDTAAPSLSIALNPPAVCFSDNPLSPTYGGTALDDKLDITSSLGTGCVANTGTLTISYLTNTYTVPLDVTLYPATNAEALALWNTIKTWVPGANGSTYTFGVKVEDCAGNFATGSFDLCIDLVAPGNTLALFDARPTDEGAWLKWSWNYNATQATYMEVWRSNYIGDYPGYPWPNPGRWQVLSSSTNYPQSYPPAGFSMVARQDGSVGTTATAFSGLNGKGNNIHNGPGSVYWKDEDASWVDESEDRGIYRYVTFVQDNAGNWSQLGGYTLNINADRSTNYWLGDYSREVTTSPDPSDGDVFTADLSLLSSVYFTSVPPTPGFFDIGPENAENGIGKGIPTPDGFINFSDLVPFSFNFGLTGPGTFNVRTPSSQPLNTLDQAPVVSVTRSDDRLLTVGDVFSVTVALTGNTENATKVVEATLTFSSDVLEFVDATASDPAVLDGVPFASAKLLPDGNCTVGVAAAALGEIAVLDGDMTLATLRFRWKAERIASTDIRFETVRLADAYGNTMDGEGSALHIGASGVIPTAYALYQNYPNSFNPSTQIRFDLPEGTNVRLVIYNIMGQSVRTLVDGHMAAGAYNVAWNGLDDSGQPVGSGMYLYRVSAGSFVQIKKMLLTR